MTQIDTSLNGAGEQLRRSDSALPDQEGKHDEYAQEEMFLCTHGNHLFSKEDAFYPGKKNPAICRKCAVEKRRQTHQREEEEKAKKLASIDQIPLSGERGGTKRSTFTLSQYVITALDVLAVGASTSEVIEKAVIHFLQQEDPQVIAFVGRMFQQSISK